MKKTLEFKIEKVIPASVDEVFEGWLSPNVSGTIWNAAEKFIMDVKPDGLFFWTLKGTAHYGRFLEVERSVRLKHTWMSPNTLGQESVVTVTFEKRGADTLITLVHSNLPEAEVAKGHEQGWTYFVNTFFEQFGNGSRKKFNFEEAKSCGAK